MLNALIDYKYPICEEESNIAGIYKCNPEVHTTAYKDLKYTPAFCKNLTDCFFEEVNSHYLIAP